MPENRDCPSWAISIFFVLSGPRLTPVDRFLPSAASPWNSRLVRNEPEFFFFHHMVGLSWKALPALRRANLLLLCGVFPWSMIFDRLKFARLRSMCQGTGHPPLPSGISRTINTRGMYNVEQDHAVLGSPGSSIGFPGRYGPGGTHFDQIQPCCRSGHTQRAGRRIFQEAGRGTDSREGQGGSLPQQPVVQGQGRNGGPAAGRRADARALAGQIRPPGRQGIRSLRPALHLQRL